LNTAATQGREVKDPKGHDRLVIPGDFVLEELKKKTTSILDITPNLEKWYLYHLMNPQTKEEEAIAAKRCRNSAEEMRLWVNEQNNKTMGDW
jgi:hypothetical protein